MIFNKEDFEKNFLNALSELIGKEFDKDSNEYTFELLADIEPKRNYSSADYYLIDFYRKHTKKSFQSSYDEIFKRFVVFTKYDNIYPLSIEISLKKNNAKVICIKVDPRYRNYGDLKNQETGHPPFKVLTKEDLKRIKYGKNKILKWIARILLLMLTVAMLVYCIKLQVQLNFLEQLSDQYMMMYQDLYEEYIEIHQEKNYLEDAYDELYDYLY